VGLQLREEGNSTLGSYLVDLPEAKPRCAQALVRGGARGLWRQDQLLSAHPPVPQLCDAALLNYMRPHQPLGQLLRRAMRQKVFSC